MNPIYITFPVVFALVAGIGLFLFYRPDTGKRLTKVLEPVSQAGEVEKLEIPKRRPIETITAPFKDILPRTAREVSVVQKRLIRAGYRDQSHLNAFYGAKVAVPLVLAALATAAGLYEYGVFFAYGISLGLGFLVPDFWLGNRVTARQLNLQLALPEALDLMVICVEAGLGLDQAMFRVTEELRLGQPALSEELYIVQLEQRAGMSRMESWKNLAERTGAPSIRALVATLTQADAFGTSVAKNLRVFSETLRTQRRQQAEEKAAKTTVKLVFPLVFCIFPSLFVVVVGPAAVLILDGFAKFGG
jgi:tight adherence protein C